MKPLSKKARKTFESLAKAITAITVGAATVIEAIAHLIQALK